MPKYDEKHDENNKYGERCSIGLLYNHVIIMGHYTWYICYMFVMDSHSIPTIRLVYLHLRVLSVKYGYLRKVGNAYLQKVSYTLCFT